MNIPLKKYKISVHIYEINKYFNGDKFDFSPKAGKNRD